MITPLVLAGLTAGGYWSFTEWQRYYTDQREDLGYTIAQPPYSRGHSALIALVIFVIEAIFLMTVL